MNKLRVAAGVYRQYWRINILTTLEYRENFLMWFAFTIVYHGAAIAALWIVLERFPSLNGWNFRDMAFLYGLWMLAHALHNTLFSAVGDVPEHVREGEFDRILVRPLDSLFQIIATPGQVFPDELMLALAYFGVATWYSGVHIDAMFVIFVPLIVFGGALIELGIGLIVSTLSFWFVRVDALIWIVVQLEQEFTRYPLGIYSRGVRLLLTFVCPFAFMNYFPASYFLHKPDNALGFPPIAGLLTPVIGCAFVILAYVFWRFGLNRYQGVGH
ncbi:MAG: ABC-2 family transporter protein [Candidatus Eremiobacteraeota bacterium]|nr:ABC-2 family transporter protein [Candidatus Eremiobacteraeota bacterium]